MTATAPATAEAATNPPTGGSTTLSTDTRTALCDTCARPWREED